MVHRNEDLSPVETAMAKLDSYVLVARTSLCTTPWAGGVSIGRAGKELQLLAGCHSCRQRRVLQESPISSRGQIPLGRQTTRTQILMSTEPLAQGTSSTLPTLRLNAEFFHELQDVVQENPMGAAWI